MYKILFLLLLPLQLLGLDLKKEVVKAEAGDFIVYSYKESLVLLRIRDVSPTMLIVEEISSPHSAVEGNWQEWVAREAPGHTSWTISRIDIASGKVLSIFSVDERQFQNTNPSFLFLPTLLELPLKPIEPHERKYVGPEPMVGEVDNRRLWRPRIVFDQREIYPKIDAFRVRWPSDASELSGKLLDLYFVENGPITFLPYWIELFGAVGRAKISALDSGRGLTSPVKMLSYEQPEKSAKLHADSPGENSVTN